MGIATEIPARSTASVPAEPTIRRELLPGDLGRIVAMHGRIYLPGYGLTPAFEGHVAKAVAGAAIAGFPRDRETIRLLEGSDGELAGSTALTDEGAGLAYLRWVLLDPSLRGRGLGRRLIAATVADARRFGFERIRLETFSDLTAAASIYRSLGFRLVSEDHTPRFGRSQFNYQRYELEL
jgi:RimJ/RimL family protein N-acetyltransferase